MTLQDKINEFEAKLQKEKGGGIVPPLMVQDAELKLLEIQQLARIADALELLLHK